METAGALEALDLVIAVDTAVIHLAGAMGRPVWSLHAIDADFRWMENRSDSPWYPSMWLYRQKAMGDWSGVVGEVARDLAELARQKSA
jgi:ADP-heptose:LPS heptosyltransferase